MLRRGKVYRVHRQERPFRVDCYDGQRACAPAIPRRTRTLLVDWGRNVDSVTGRRMLLDFLAKNPANAHIVARLGECSFPEECYRMDNGRPVVRGVVRWQHPLGGFDCSDETYCPLPCYQRYESKSGDSSRHYFIFVTHGDLGRCKR